MTTALPGWAIDLITDGVDLRGVPPKRIRSEVVAAVRRVMFSAHRAGMPYDSLYVLLTDRQNRRLAAQLATGHGGRTIPIASRTKLLREQWDSTAAVVAATPRIDAETIEAHLSLVRDALDADDELSDRERAVMHGVLALAEGWGTTRVAASSHMLADMLDQPQTTVAHVLRRLAAAGHWLSLAQKGDARKRRASLYRVGPGLAAYSHMGASPPMSNPDPCPPMSNPTYEQSQRSPMATVSMTLTLSGDDEAAVLALLAERAAQRNRPRTPVVHDTGVSDDTTAHVVHLTDRRVAR